MSETLPLARGSWTPSIRGYVSQRLRGSIEAPADSDPVQASLRKYCPHAPEPKQAEFLKLDTLEALYGGAAGGGKSDALMMAALMHVHVPGYAAILFRRTYPQLSEPDALIPRSFEWLGHTDAVWHETKKRWRFPSGATLSFGHLQHDKSIYDYQGPSYQFIGFDELTQFTLAQYRYLFSRLRRLEGFGVPLRARATSNPGGAGHDWVKRWFVNPGHAERPFIPATLEDNPHLDAASYEESLSRLDPITRAQLRHGDWEIRPGGSLFRREWFEIVDASPAKARWVRYWDLASTEPKEGRDPDWTAGLLMGAAADAYFVADVKRIRARPNAVDALIKQTAELDGKRVDIWIEQEPGSSGKRAIEYFVRLLAGFTVRGHRTTGPKEVRANPLSSQAEAGNVKLVRGPWIDDFLDEIEAFPGGSHDDQVDAASGAFDRLTLARKAAGTWGRKRTPRA